jgi:hypothetical protein
MVNLHSLLKNSNLRLPTFDHLILLVLSLRFLPWETQFFSVSFFCFSPFDRYGPCQTFVLGSEAGKWFDTSRTA